MRGRAPRRSRRVEGHPDRVADGAAAAQPEVQPRDVSRAFDAFSAGDCAVEAEEEFVKIGGRRDQVDRVMAGDDLQYRPDLAGHVERHSRPLGRGDGDAPQAAQLCRVDRVAEADLHLLGRGSPQALHGVLGHQPAFPDDPDPVGAALHLAQLVRGQEDGPALGSRLLQQVLELALHQRVKPGCRLVEHQQLRPVHESQHQADLLAVPLRQFTDRAVGHDLEPVDQMPGE